MGQPVEAKGITLSRQGELGRQAAAIAAYHFSSGRTEPEELARHLGISFRYHPLIEDIDGLILHNGGRFFIICNSRVAAPGSARSRFTFCHELAHALVVSHAEALKSRAWPVLYCRTNGRSRLVEELEADSFAGQLLLPESAVRAYVGQVFPGLGLIARCADHFGASVTATAYRALKLESYPSPAAVLRWDKTGRLVSKNISTGTMIRDLEFWTVSSAPPATSLTAEAISNLRVGTVSGAIRAHRWFPHLSPGDPEHEIVLREEVRSLGEHGWITLLSAES